MEQVTVTYDDEKARAEQRMIDQHKSMQLLIDQQQQEIVRLRALLTAVGVLAQGAA